MEFFDDVREFVFGKEVSADSKARAVRRQATRDARPVQAEVKTLQVQVTEARKQLNRAHTQADMSLWAKAIVRKEARISKLLKSLETNEDILDLMGDAVLQQQFTKRTGQVASVVAAVNRNMPMSKIRQNAMAVQRGAEEIKHKSEMISDATDDIGGDGDGEGQTEEMESLVAERMNLLADEQAHELPAVPSKGLSLVGPEAGAGAKPITVKQEKKR